MQSSPARADSAAAQRDATKTARYIMQLLLLFVVPFEPRWITLVPSAKPVKWQGFDADHCGGAAFRERQCNLDGGGEAAHRTGYERSEANARHVWVRTFDRVHRCSDGGRHHAACA